VRVATIDIGTNSVLLLVGERRGDTLVPLVERATITRLGRGVDRTRTLDDAAVSETLECLEGYARELRSAGVERVDAVGTSAMRDARGGAELRARARDILGVEPRVISGDEEAALTFTGALAGLALEGPVVVFDLGGGSTEIIQGNATRGGRDESELAVSLDIGAVRLTERHLRSDPPRPEELLAVRADARDALSALTASWGARRRVGAPVRVVGVAGTVTTLAAHSLGVVPYTAARVHGARLGRADVARMVDELAGATLAQRRAMPAIDPKRADVILAGALIVDEIVTWAGADELIVSDRGVRWGLALRLAAT
jgi:exopolyphosphatase/guanosine-5'-triphosphate,3'-diphosphate pyrophosphatase